MNKEKRLIEQFLPIEVISRESAREKNLRKGNVSSLHLWWARRPLAACRAAVYATLVPAVTLDCQNHGGAEQPEVWTRITNFFEVLCKQPAQWRTILEAETRILEAHAKRLRLDSTASPRPRVLDIFAGGGSIPLEALRLGCDAIALDLNPVAHIVELATLVFPQKYGRPDESATGISSDGAWAGLRDEVRHWGKWLLDSVRERVGDLYPAIPTKVAESRVVQKSDSLWHLDKGEPMSSEDLIPIAYLWTRSVICKNPTCRATVPLLKQSWLCKKENQWVAVRVHAPKGTKQPHFEVVSSTTQRGLGFNPDAGSTGGNATVPVLRHRLR